LFLQGIYQSRKELSLYPPKSYPRTIDPANTFNALVDWFYDDVLIYHKAPGLLVGLSGTDSLVTFCAAATALEKAGKPNRMLGVHFAPSEDFLYDHPEAETHLWFRDQVLPWLHKRYPDTQIIVDVSIDWRYDGLRWGTLMDMSVVSNDKVRRMRSPEEQYWVVGTRNRTEDCLMNYSNVSKAASLQPLIYLWKSEILRISEYLDVPQIAIAKSCETDCICGRMALPSQHIQEMDMLLMVRCGELSDSYVEKAMSNQLRRQLTHFIEQQISKSSFKKHIPYTTKHDFMYWSSDPLVAAFEAGTLNLKEFNHRKHVYVAWCYLQSCSFEEALQIYAHYLRGLLETAGQSHRFNLEMTRSYFVKIDEAIKLYPMANFDELVEKIPSLLGKTSI
jgi:NH3-dependent NAD+ synthetase